MTEAEAFLHDYAVETGTGVEEALAAVRAGHYRPDAGQLAFAGRLAWRHSARCLGRGYVPALRVRDLRGVSDAPAAFAALREHLHLAWNGGRIRPLMTVLGPGLTVLNDQLIRYAGYRGGRGDPKNRALTERLLAMGWQPPAQPGDFDVLPLAIRDALGVQLFEWERGDVHEVHITHPECPEIAELGLRWHALPVIADMEFRFAGLRYPCAPFSGWYLQTEIAARNLADRDRYDRLPDIARALGLDTSRERTLWRDRALVELNRAVLHSFDAAGVRIDDHHSLAAQHVAWEEREAGAGRTVNGRWDWLIPPLSPATTPVWGRTYREDRRLTPGFFPRRRAGGCPVTGG